MIRIYNGGDIKFDISSEKSNIDKSVNYYIKFFTTNPDHSIIKDKLVDIDTTNYTINLNWAELDSIGRGVLQYTYYYSLTDETFDDKKFDLNNCLTTDYFIVSNNLINDFIITDSELSKYLGDKIEKEVSESISSGKFSLSKSNISYKDLKALRDNNQLIAGMKYRITDYQCTTTQAKTRSAGHTFDIIVEAISSNKLVEEATAVLHDGDTYFASSNLSAWKIWYSIDNNVDKYVWADSTNGKGVIYRMIDEYRNDVPYDFKSIQFIPYSTDGSITFYVYTFNSTNADGGTDLSLSGDDTGVNGNIIKKTYDGINLITFLGNNCYNNIFDIGCFGNTFDSGCYNNTFDIGSSNNVFGTGCYNNVFRNECCNNTFGTECINNVFGSELNNNILGNSCCNNTFGDKCNKNTFGTGCSNNILDINCTENILHDKCYKNRLDENCSNIILGDNSYGNTFGVGSYGNTFGTGCYGNTFDIVCYGNTLGDSCCNNSFDSNCSNNTFGIGCSGNKLGIYCLGNTFDAGSCSNIFSDNCYNNNFSGYIVNNSIFNCFGITLTSNNTDKHLKNLLIKSGVTGSVVCQVSNQDYQWTISKNSTGNIIQYCEDDQIDIITNTDLDKILV